MAGQIERWHRQAKDVISAVLDLLFPPTAGCVCCGAMLYKGEKCICAACREQIAPLTEPTCSCCGRPLAYPGLCDLCCFRTYSFIRSWSAAVYQGVLRKCLHRFKYERATCLAPVLGSLLAQRLQAAKGILRFPLLVPVPLDSQRLHERGFNQAELLAAEVARVYRWPMAKKVLRRLRPTLPQSELPENKRWLNVSGAFVAEGDLSGKKVLLIDDIYTTGATAEAASQALLKAGAAQVYVATVAIASRRCCR